LSSAALTIVAPRAGVLGRFRRWLDALPHPRWVLEISPEGVAGARSVRGAAGLEHFAQEPVSDGAIVPSPVDLNIIVDDPVRAALRAVLGRLGARGQPVALLIPDQAVRVFLLKFDKFPRRAEEAVPLVRWRLKKSVPFDVEETTVSYMVQPAREEGVEVLAALARGRIVRQYEELVTSAGAEVGVVSGSTLATLPLVAGDRPALLARLSGSTLTTVIVRGEALAVYRSTNVGADAAHLTSQMLLEEVYPAVAYFQDTWKENVELVYLAGMAGRAELLRQPVATELGCRVSPLLSAETLPGADVRALAERRLEPLVGWMHNRGA
jgi:type IV pilus assembly protein PilM